MPIEQQWLIGPLHPRVPWGWGLLGDGWKPDDKLLGHITGLLKKLLEQFSSNSSVESWVHATHLTNWAVVDFFLPPPDRGWGRCMLGVVRCEHLEKASQAAGNRATPSRQQTVDISVLPNMQLGCNDARRATASESSSSLFSWLAVKCGS